jgi:hypothetical protein
VLFHLDGHSITLVPQLVWITAPIAYYIAALRLIRQATATDSAAAGLTMPGHIDTCQ